MFIDNKTGKPVRRKVPVEALSPELRQMALSYPDGFIGAIKKEVEIHRTYIAIKVLSELRGTDESAVTSKPYLDTVRKLEKLHAIIMKVSSPQGMSGVSAFTKDMFQSATGEQGREFIPSTKIQEWQLDFVETGTIPKGALDFLNELRNFRMGEGKDTFDNIEQVVDQGGLFQ